MGSAKSKTKVCPTNNSKLSQTFYILSQQAKKLERKNPEYESFIPNEFLP